MSTNDLDEFLLLKYFNATPTEIIHFLNNYSLEDIKYHLKMIDNTQDFEKFFINYKKIYPDSVNEYKKLLYLEKYYYKLIRKSLFIYK
jgi:hypothetical protein